MEEKQILLTPEIKRYRESMGILDPCLVAEKLGHPLHKGQQEIAKYFTKDYIHTWSEATWLISRRWGKSFLGQTLATTLMLTPESRIFVCCHSTSLSDVWWREVLKNLTSISELRGKVEWSKKEGTIEIPELNTSFVCSSYLNAQSRAVGKSFTILFKDEFFLVPPEDQEDIYNLITPTMANYGSTDDGIKYGKQVILSTPRGSVTGSHSGLTYLKGVNKEKGYLSFTYTIYDSPFLTKQEIEHIKETTAKDVFAQEYMCEFTRTTKTVFRNFIKEKHIINITESELKDMAYHCELIIALDFGIIDGNGASVVLYNNKSDTYYVIDEHYAKDEVSYDFIKRMKAKMEEWSAKLDIPFDNIMWFYDPSALESARIAQKSFNLTLYKAKNKRTEGIDYVNGLLQGKGDGSIPQIYFRDTCTTHIDMFEYAEFKVINGVISNQFAKDPSERQSHYECCVTTVYATYTHFKTSHTSIIVV